MATKSEILDELEEVEMDLSAFKSARDVIQARLRELEESNPSRYEILASWPATVAIWNVLILAIVRCEGLLDDYHKALEAIELSGTLH